MLTVRYPITWKLLDMPVGYTGGNQAYLDFALSKHEAGLPESRGETPTASDVFVNFGLLLDRRSPYDFYDTIEFGPSAVGQIIEHGTFNGYPAMFASIGNPPDGVQRQVLFQVSPGVLVSLDVEFPVMQGASPEYIRETLAEIDGILASVRADAEVPTPVPTPNVFATVPARPK